MKYKMAQFSLMRCCQSRGKRFFGRALRIMEAPEPSNILWENQDIGRKEYSVRRLITGLVSAVIILVSVGLVMLSKTYGDQETKKLQGNMQTCNATETIRPDVAQAAPAVPLDAQTGALFLRNQLQASAAYNYTDQFSSCQCSQIGDAAVASFERGDQRIKN